MLNIACLLRNDDDHQHGPDCSVRLSSFFSWRFVAMRGWWASFSWSGAYRLSAPRVLRGNFAQGRTGCTAAGACESAAAVAKFCRLMPESESYLRKVRFEKDWKSGCQTNRGVGKKNERSKDYLPARKNKYYG